MNALRTIAIGVVAGGALVARAAPAPVPDSAPRPHADITFRGVRLWEFKGSALSAVASAETLTWDRGAGAGLATQTEATLPGRHGDPRPVHLEAGEAQGQLSAHTVDARSGVKLQREDGSATSTSAHFDGTQHRVSGSEPVDVVTPHLTMRGQAFTLDTQTEQIDLLGPVDGRGEVHP